MIRERLIYLLQTKLETELSHEIIKDIDGAIYDTWNDAFDFNDRVTDRVKVRYFNEIKIWAKRNDGGWTMTEKQVEVLTIEEAKNNLFIGNCLDTLKRLPDNSIDACITDPPYGLSKEPNVTEVLTKWLAGESYSHNFKGFMGKEWDSFVPSPEIWKEVFRVLKPGGHAIVFSGTRTQDLMTIALRIAGFEVRDVIEWLYFSGFPKSMDISKQIDKMAGAEREVIGEETKAKSTYHSQNVGGSIEEVNTYNITAPATPEAIKYQGFGTQLKPSHEPAILVRKPIAKGANIAENVLHYGTGGLNIDETRIGEETISAHNAPKGTFAGGEWERGSETIYREHQGRFPANCITLDDDQFYSKFFNITPPELSKKASKKDRNSNCEGVPIDGANNHPTVKPIPLMEWLVKLITPPNGIIIEPFAGSGSTLVAAKKSGFDFIGCELSEEYAEIIKKRLCVVIEEIEEDEDSIGFSEVDSLLEEIEND
jgi:site-specific DNA-methyltransferase (adenine-specific)